MLNTLGQPQDRPFYLYKIITKGREATGVLVNYRSHQAEGLSLLPHEQISMSHAMKIKKMLQNKACELPPCALIAELDFSVLNWQQDIEQLARWSRDSDNSDHYLYRVTGEASIRLLAEQLAGQEALLIADGHHRAFAATLPHSPLKDLPVWITSTSIEVNSFALRAEIPPGFEFDTLKQKLITFGIEACCPSISHYSFSYRQQQQAYCYPAAGSDTYKIQHQIRTALRQIKELNNFTSLPQKYAARLKHRPNTLLIRLSPPKIGDIIKAAKKGHYFPEKSTYFPHKTCAKVLDLISA
mgnify:CR=1 FL=1